MGSNSSGEDTTRTTFKDSSLIISTLDKFGLGTDSSVDEIETEHGNVLRNLMCKLTGERFLVNSISFWSVYSIAISEFSWIGRRPRADSHDPYRYTCLQTKADPRDLEMAAMVGLVASRHFRILPGKMS